MSLQRVHDSILTCIGSTPLVRLSRCFPEPGTEVLAKLEMLNPAGSMKDRPARFIVERGLREGTLRPGMRLVESTSGNFGVALAMVARLRQLQFTAVVDPNIAPANLRLLEIYGADVQMVTDTDHTGGYLGSRVHRARQLAASSPTTVWINQYANELNWRAYYETVGAEILTALDGPVDYLVCAVSTTGSVLGLARRLRERWPALRVVAVDAVGSVIFGGAPGHRGIPGYGASRVPEILDASEIDDVVHVDDLEAAGGCHRLVATEGILGGGSCGAVVAAITRLLPDLPRPCRLLTLLPDRGERYLDLVYDDDWLQRLADRLGPRELARLLEAVV